MDGFEDFSEIIDLPGEDGLFFPAAGRQKAVESLRHFAEYGSMLLFLRGAAGSGRTTVLDRFALTVDSDTQVVGASASDGDIIASLAQKVDQLSFEFDQLAEKLATVDVHSEGGLEGEGSERAPSNSEENDWVLSPRLALTNYLRRTSARGRRLIAVLDDCQAMNDEDLTILVELAEQFEGVFKLVFSGDDALADRVGDYSEREAILINFIDLPEFTLEDAEAYVDYRLQAAGYAEFNPFRREQIANALQRSEGSIPKFHQLLSDIPIKPTAPIKTPLIPLPHLLASLLLLALIGVLLFLDDDTSIEDEPTPIVLQKLEPKLEEASPQPAEAANTEIEAEAPPAEEISDTERSVIVDAEPEKTAAAVIVAARQADPQENNDVDVVLDSADAAIDEQGAKESLPEALPADVLPSTSDSSGVAPSSTHKRLLAWPETGYALQVFGTHNQARAEELVANYFGQADLLFYETRHNGKAWFVVITGPYSGSQAARRGIADLPDGLRGLRPWPRNIASIHRDIRRYHGE